MIKVTCNPPKNKKGYTVNFRHNIIKDKDGKYGRKIHRGLGTDNEQEAQKMVGELEELLNNEYWWDRSKKSEAYNKFSSVVVDAYYDCMESEMAEEIEYLDKIYLPGKSEGYTRATIIGPTGYGKTSLLRNLAGTVKDNFPATSSGRTTTCNTELILSDEGEYEVVVTFMNRHIVEMYIQECIEAAVNKCLASESGCDDASIARNLLVHRDLTLRLNYILGDLSLRASDVDDDFDDEFLEEDEEAENACDSETNGMLDVIDKYISIVKNIANNLREQRINTDTPEFNFEENEEVLSLKEDIIEEIIKRFDLLIDGEKLNSKGKWVNAWYYRTTSRDEFIKILKLFSSNSKKEYGKLLTPIVHTMRIKGNFDLECEHEKKLVLFDGQGLGHTVAATSLPSDLTQYISISDAVILVDKATTPMLENIKMALKALIEYGFAEKTALIYTHVDQMKGDNFANFTDKKNHIIAALDSYLYELRKKNVDILSEKETEGLKSNIFFFSSLDNEEASKMTKKFRNDLICYLENITEEASNNQEIKLHYDAMTLYEHLKIAIYSYRNNWREIIGYPTKTDKTKHWSKVQALTRRLAYFNQDHYNYELMPLADFRQSIAEQLNIFLNRPMDVELNKMSDDMVALINDIKREINAELASFINEEMWKREDQFTRWNEAYSYEKKYSEYYRASKINEILELAAPQISEFEYNMTDIQKDYIRRVLEIVEKTLIDNNATLEKFKY